jgi:hypothetical protein
MGATAVHRSSGLRRLAHLVSPWTGLALLLYLLGGLLWLQWQFAVDATFRSPAEVGGLPGYALAAVGCAAVALLSGRVRRPVLLLALGLAVWVGSRAVSGWLLDSQVESAALLVAVTLAGLAIAVAAIPAAVAGWTIAAVGTWYIYANLFVLWQNYFSTGVAYPGVAQWKLYDPMWVTTRTPTQRPLDTFPAPEPLWERIQAFVGIGEINSTAEDPGGYLIAGLGGNPNGTSTFAALSVVFLAAFSLRVWGSRRRHQPTLVMLCRAALFLATVPAGILLIYLSNGRAALGGVGLALVILILPLRWAHSRLWSWAFAMATPLLILAPFAVAQAGIASWNGRDCTWQAWWQAIQPAPLSGYGPPGIFPITGCTLSPYITEWWHAHNELFQAWGVGGVLGLAVASAVLMTLAWWGFRGRDRDERVLLGLITCCAVLLGFEVLVEIISGWIRPTLILFTAIAARSVQMIAATPTHPPSALEEPGTHEIAATAAR